MKVWVVSIVDEEPEVFATAQGAYEYIKERAESCFDKDDGIDEILKELAEDYAKYPDSFGIEEFGGALAYIPR